MGEILVVDDEQCVRDAFLELFSGLGHEVQTANSGEEALRRIRTTCPDVVVTDLYLPGMSGLEAIRQIRAENSNIPVIVMTGRGTMDTAIEATKLGAFDYQLKPFEPESMVAAIERALESVRLMHRSVELNPGAAAEAADAIVGDSSSMQEVFKAIGRVAATDATVLIRGESGTGKELVARALYQHSLRAAFPLHIVNCAAIPDALLESELFGHERGAFTSAHARKIGKFEQADQGTIFLDEAGEIPLAVQAKVLRVLQQKTFERVGGNETIRANVRVLAATNRNLEQAISEGTFREDLYHRLNVVTITIPPLRDRRGDIPRLVKYFVDRYSRELHIDNPLLANEARDALVSYDWPGNVRELEHCIYRTLIFTRGYPVQVADVQRALGELQSTAGAPAANVDEQLLISVIRRHLDGQGGAGTYDRLVGRFERLLIAEALQRTGGNQTQAAQLLGLPRPTLHAKIQRHGISNIG